MSSETSATRTEKNAARAETSLLRAEMTAPRAERRSSGALLRSNITWPAFCSARLSAVVCKGMLTSVGL